jgi:hypothetical protein
MITASFRAVATMDFPLFVICYRSGYTGAMKTIIAVVDGMGGGIGSGLIGRIKEIIDSGHSGHFGGTEIIALGTNAVAAERMVKAGAHRGASGENAVRVMAKTASFILGPIGIVIADSMMGEITPVMAASVLSAPGERILLPLQQEHFFIAGLEQLPMTGMIDRAVEILKSRLSDLSLTKGRKTD